jgi:hypothetical protein
MDNITKASVEVYKRQLELSLSIINLSRLKGDYKTVSEMKQVIRTCKEQIKLLSEL